MDNISFPETNVYYEKVSADGYAFLGASQALANEDHTACLEAINERNWSLNSPQQILKTHTTAENKYIYTLWTCAELFHAINDTDNLHKIASIVQDIGKYPNGMMRYCSEEIYYLVPNVTSAAILVYTMTGRHVAAKKLAETLYSNQDDNGNWRYYTLNDDLTKDKRKRQEDCYHVAMMIYHLRMARKLNPKLKVAHTIEHAAQFLIKAKPRCGSCKKLKHDWLCPGSIGWGVPMTYAAISGLANIDNNIEQARKLTVEYLTHSNFRVRAMARWALTKTEQI